jgi:hypothetical protein
MTQTWHDTIQGTPHRGYKLEGRQFGELTVVRAVDRRDTNILWLCRCDCGRVALRTSVILMRAETQGTTPMCCVCLAELRGGQFLQRRAHYTQKLIEMYWMSGSLYGLGFAQQFRDEMVDELTEAGFPNPEEPALSLPLSMEPPYRKCGAVGQRAAYLVPITGRLWQCPCAQHFNEGFACMACRDPICRDCVQQEKHLCDHTRRAVWEDVMVPKVLAQVEEKGVLFQSPTTLEKQIERFQILAVAQALRDQVAKQAARTQAQWLAHQKQAEQLKEEELQKRFRMLRKKHPWLAQEMGITKKKATR